MTTTPTPRLLLEALAALNDRLRAALHQNDFEQAEHLVTERGHLVAALDTAGRPAELPAVWHALAETLSAQHRALESSFAAAEQRLHDELASLGQLRHAHRHYHPTEAAPAVLRTTLRG